MYVCPSVRPSVRPSVCPSVRKSVCPSVSLSLKISVTTELIGFYSSLNIPTGHVVVLRKSPLICFDYVDYGDEDEPHVPLFITFWGKALKG